MLNHETFYFFNYLFFLLCTGERLCFTNNSSTCPTICKTKHFWMYSVKNFATCHRDRPRILSFAPLDPSYKIRGYCQLAACFIFNQHAASIDLFHPLPESVNICKGFCCSNSIHPCCAGGRSISSEHFPCLLYLCEAREGGSQEG